MVYVGSGEYEEEYCVHNVSMAEDCPQCTEELQAAEAQPTTSDQAVTIEDIMRAGIP